MELQINPKMYSFTLILLVICVEGCNSKPAPVDPSLLWKSISNIQTCQKTGASTNAYVQIRPWGIFYQPVEVVTFLSDAVCETKILFDYPRADKEMVIRYRPQAYWKDLEKIHPGIKTKYFTGQMRNIAPLCNDIPYRIIRPWGPRNTFVKLLREVIKNLERMRDFQEGSCNGRGALKPYQTLQKHKIANAAITYLRTVGYTYWVCI